MFYGLKDKCTHCDEATLFEYNTNTGFFDVVRTDEHLHDLLNAEAVKHGYGLVWTNTLELAEHFVVQVGGLFHNSFIVGSGVQLDKVGNLSFYLNNEDFGVADETDDINTLYNSSSIVSSNMSVIIGRWVQVIVGKPISKTLKVFADKTVEYLEHFFEKSLDGFVIINNENEVLNKSSVFETSTVLTLCHNVEVTGYVNQSVFLEHGKDICNNTLFSKFCDPPFIIYESKNKSAVFKRGDAILHDTHLIIGKVSKLGVILEFEQKDNITEKNVEDALKDMANLQDNDALWIDVTQQEDGSFIVSVTVLEEKADSFLDQLQNCSQF